MTTLVCFHAHPDDEALATAGTMALAAAAGHRVILVLATRGEQGEPVPGVLNDGEKLWERRVIEAQESAEILGADRVVFLGYEDSGMMGESTNENPECFWQADVAEAAVRLAAVLREESADVVTMYDPDGGYGHPDHIQVHRVGTEATKIAGIESVFWSTMNRTRIIEWMTEAVEQGLMSGSDFPDMDTDTFGMDEADITHAIDVSSVLLAKRRAIAAHASQVAPDDFFLALPDEAFAEMFGTEWFVAPGRARGPEPFAPSLFG